LCRRYSLPLSRPLVMGVVNVTPDSFSDGGMYQDAARAIAHARQLIADGAAILDIGGESTRPGAHPVSADEELARVLPVLTRLLDAGVPLSVDTSKPEVMRKVLAAGADMINDINGFRADGALDIVAESGAGLCIMHMQGEPRTMQADPHYDDVVSEVGAFLRERALSAERAGIARQRLLVDPGFGFGKSLAHNLELLRHLGRIVDLGWPVLAGLSRKSMLGRITGRAVEERVHASVAAALLAVVNGARIVRAHDVRATCDALSIFNAVNAAGASVTCTRNNSSSARGRNFRQHDTR
jgi:dihydropteroate synthase